MKIYLKKLLLGYCESNLDHKPIATTIYYKGNCYCAHLQCIQKLLIDFPNINTTEGFIELINYITPKSGVDQNTFYFIQCVKYHIANNDKRDHFNMQQFFDAAVQAHEIMINHLKQYGVNEFKVKEYISWYENIRDVRLSPPEDTTIYEICKKIANFEDEVLNLKKLFEQGKLIVTP